MSDDLRQKFLTVLRASVEEGTLRKLTLGKPQDSADGLENLHVRPVVLRAAPHYTFVWRHTTRDITKNHSPADTLAQLESLIGIQFRSAHLFTAERTTQLEYNKKGVPRLTAGKAAELKSESGHDRVKPRVLTPDSQPWLQALGILTAAGTVSEGMADKHRQIHKFVEILSHLSNETNLPVDRPLEIADMGCGKGYLTFAMHDYFNLVSDRVANVTGFEARPALVEFCNGVAQQTQRPRLHFEAGVINEAKLPTLDVLIALHACDTATDDALAGGIASDATLLVVAPCCQKELRPQLHAAPVLAPALRHGIFQERHAEFATDALRALLLEWAGYETKVFEFISTEHTAKNTMITAVKRSEHRHGPVVAEKIRTFAGFYGVKTQALARHLGFNLAEPG
jgi:SAM-dependent methyltransferase